MEPEILSAFIEDGQNMLAGVRASVLTAIRGNGRASDFAGSIGLIRSLRSTALAFPAEELQGRLSELETQVTAAAQSNSGLASDLGIRLLDQLAAMEATLGFHQLTAYDPNFDVSGFVDESFKSLVMPRHSEAKNVSALPEIAETDEFEIDDEMLEVFALEAEDLLGNIESSLKQLETDPDNRDALWEIRRYAHTYKGAAGIIGLRKQSELAHRVEDLLDRIAESDGAPVGKLLEIIRSSAGVLREMTAGATPEYLSAALEQIDTGIQDVIGALNSDETTIQPAPPKMEQTGPDAPAAFRTAVLPAVKPDRKSIVRVSLDRLDDLVANVRDLVINRSVFEQLLDDLERQIDDLQNGTRRLQAACSRLEMEFESSKFQEGTAECKTDVPADSGKNFDPLELDRYSEFHRNTRELSETASDASSIGTELESVRRNLEALFDNQHRLTGQLQERLMQIRMVEFGSLTTRLQRAVRVTCEEEGKHAEIVIENGQLEVDTQILDALVEPLIHLLKNAVVHGIEDPETRRLVGKSETGKILIRLTGEDTHLVVTVSDDGRGLSAAALCAKAVQTGKISSSDAECLTIEQQFELIFLPGLTTAEKLNLSAGRGVGMSIVKESIESRNGTISFASSPQRGTTFAIRLPVPMAVTNVLLVRAGRRSFAIPTKHIARIESISAGCKKGSTVTYSGRDYPVRPLSEIAGLPSTEAVNCENLQVLIIRSQDRGFAVAVNDVFRSEEVIIEPLRRPLDSIPGILGAAILGTGELVPVLNLPELLDGATAAPERSVAAEQDLDPFILVVDDSPSVRHSTSKVVRSAGWEVETAKDGLDALDKLRSAPSLPAMILSDVEMPRMDGYDFAANLKASAALKDIPFIFITSRSGEKHRERAAELGVCDYLPKPFDEKALLHLIALRTGNTSQAK